MGSIPIEDGERSDLGLDLKRNGQYQLLGYVRVCSQPSSCSSSAPSSQAKVAAWVRGDTVKIVGSAERLVEKVEGESFQWEFTGNTYSNKAISRG